MLTKRILIAVCIVYGSVSVKQSFAQINSQLRVLSFNIYHGEKYYADISDDEKSNLAIVANIIDSLKPDLVALQEVDINTNRSNGQNLMTLLACKTNMMPLFGKAIDFDGGEYGGSILSRHSFIKTESYRLVGESDSEPRIALSAVIQLSCGQRVHFIGTHLDHTSDALRERQVEHINQLFSQDTIPMVLAGDLNATPESNAMQSMMQKWQITSKDMAPTIPADAPKYKIDYILCDKSKHWKVIESHVVDTQKASDHKAVFSILEWTKQ